MSTMRWWTAVAGAIAISMLGAGTAQAANNLPPTITAPASISGTEDTLLPLTAVSFDDLDSNGLAETVTLSVADGTLAAAGANLTITGSGTSGVTLRGTIADLDAAFASGSVTYLGAADDNGNETLSIDVDDEGNTGDDGPKSADQDVTLSLAAVNDAPRLTLPSTQTILRDTDLVFSAGNGNAITVADVDAAGGTEEVTLTATNGVLTLAGTSGLSFTVGSGTGDATMTFDGTLADIATALNGLTFSPTTGYAGSAGIDLAVDDLGSTGSGGAQTSTGSIPIQVNAPNPTVTTLAATTADGTYATGATVTLTVGFSQAVTVDTTGGTPTLALNASSGALASYVAGSGTSTLTFNYVVGAGDQAADLDAASTSALTLNGATIRNGSGDAAILTLPSPGAAGSLGAAANLVVDGVAPTVQAVTVPADGAYRAGTHLDFTVQLSEPVDVGGGTPAIALDLGAGATREAHYFGGSGTDTLTFRYDPAAGDDAPGGLVPAAAITLHGATMRDDAGNDASLSLGSGVPSAAGVIVDTTAPTATLTRTGATPTAGGTLTWTLAFSEPVTGVDAGDVAVTAVGAATTGTLSVTAVDAKTYTVTLTGAGGGAGTVAVAVKPSGTAIADAAGNALGGTPPTGDAYTIAPVTPPSTGGGGSTTAPPSGGGTPPATTTPVTPPAGGTTAPPPPAKVKPAITTARLAASCTRSATLTVTLRVTGATRVVAVVHRLKASGKAPRSCGARPKAPSSALRPGANVGTHPLTLAAAGKTQKLRFRHGLKPGAYVITFTAVAADGTRSAPVERRVRIL